MSTWSATTPASPSDASLTAIAGPLKELNIRFKPRTYRNLTDHNPYTGPPSAQVDAAWDALLGDMNLRVSATELAQDHQESVALPEGGGHLAWLGAMHEIHCVVSIEMWLRSCDMSDG